MGIEVNNLKALFRDSNNNKRTEYVRVLNSLVSKIRADDKQLSIADLGLLTAVQKLLDVHYVVEQNQCSPIYNLSKDLFLAILNHPKSEHQQILQDILDLTNQNNNLSEDLELYKTMHNHSLKKLLSEEIRNKIDEKFKTLQEALNSNTLPNPNDLQNSTNFNSSTKELKTNTVDSNNILTENIIIHEEGIKFIRDSDDIEDTHEGSIGENITYVSDQLLKESSSVNFFDLAISSSNQQLSINHQPNHFLPNQLLPKPVAKANLRML